MSHELITKGKLFKEGKIFSEYAYFGWGEEDAQFYVYSEGYKKSGDILIEQGLKNNDHNLKDKLVFPIIFSYRQYLELIMKHLFLEYSYLSREEKEKKIK
ncbi:MAG: hypothetical protein N4A68_05005 [Maledivibacter sp.]|jgi:predicted restriction endonuclease|nr:hypothetical protein [Maledivibacter sp.]